MWIDGREYLKGKDSLLVRWNEFGSMFRRGFTGRQLGHVSKDCSGKVKRTKASGNVLLARRCLSV